MARPVGLDPPPIFAARHQSSESTHDLSPRHFFWLIMWCGEVLTSVHLVQMGASPTMDRRLTQSKWSLLFFGLVHYHQL